MPGEKLSSSKGETDGQENANDGQGRFHVDVVIDPASSDSEVYEEDEDDQEDFNHNQQTWLPQYDKTLGQLTREALPSEKQYEDDSINRISRPGVDTLHYSQSYTKEPKHVAAAEDGPVLKGKVIKFSWLEGVLMRCLLNIWGVMLFLRLSWVVGQAGVWQGLCLITLANIVTYITAISMSAVATNGQIKGGGIYYMISRSLGPEFGAAIGLMFTVANSVAVALHIIGFGESFIDLLKSNGIEKVVDGSVNDIRIYGVAVLILILILAFIGMDWVTRAQMLFLVILLAAQVDYVVGTVIGPVDDLERAKGYTGYNIDTWNVNFNSDYRPTDGKEQSFFTVFSIYFPSVTGIVAGANLSGDLKDPASAIPKGTILAITITYVSYFIYVLTLGATVVREATGIYPANVTDAEEAFAIYTNCGNETDYICDFGLLNDRQVMELSSSWGPLIYMGCFAATLSSAIASLVGAPRVLQALAKDKLYPVIHFFAAGYGANNDPVRGYILVFLIALGCIIIGELNAIAPLMSNFFVAAYCLINFSVFHASITKSPGWRPSFKYYNAWVSLVGSVLCVVVMFLMNWITALITVGVSVTLYLYVSYRAPDVNWGSSTQAQSFNTAISSVQNLNNVEEHVKNYRPQVLVLSGLPSARPALIDFTHLLVKNLSLLICGHVVKHNLNQKARNQLSRQAYQTLAKHKRKGFYSLIEDDKYDRGVRSIMQLSGLGKLKPNLVMMGYKNEWRAASGQSVKEYVNIIHEALNMHLAVSILRVPGGLDYSNLLQEDGHLTMREILELNKPSNSAPKIRLESQMSHDPELISSDEEPPPSPLPPAVQTDQVEDFQKKRSRKKSVSALFAAKGGAQIPKDVLASVTQFKRKQKKGMIDVWWLYDDGGLTILLPYILSTRTQFSDCRLRIFTLTSRADQLGQAQRNMAALLAKFRIDYADVIVIPDVTQKAKEATKREFEEVIAPFKDDDVDDGSAIRSSELVVLREKTNRHLRLRELLLEHSKDSTFVVMTLPIPRRGTVSAPLYMAWLEMITRDMPPFLLVRGNQTSVLTFYS